MRKAVRLAVWVLVVLLFVVTLVNHTWAKLPPMRADDGAFITLAGKEIHYVDQPGNGTPVVMIHGLPGTHEDFDPVVPKLAGLRVISVDRPGFGWSNGGWLPYQDQIDVVHELVDRLELGPVVVVGHSFGGTVALGLARRYPRDVAKLVLVAPGAGGMRSSLMDVLQARYVQFSHLPVIRTAIDAVAGDVTKRMTATAGAEEAFAPAPVDAAYERRLLAVTMTPGNLDAFAADQLEFDATAQWVDDNVGQITVPSVIIAAEQDRLVGMEHVRTLAATLPGTELVTVDGGHMIPYSHPDVVAAEVREATAAEPAGR